VDDEIVVHVHAEKTPGDRPDIEDLLAAVDEMRESFVFDCTLEKC
jgi:hypothetical protein